MRSITLAVTSAVAVFMAAPHIHAQARASGATSAPLTPHTMPAGRYEFTSTGDNGDVTSGAVSWAGPLMRIDLDRNRRHAHRDGNVSMTVSDNRRGEYMLVDFGTNTMRTVKPAEHEISEMSLATFEQIIGKALGMVGSVVQMQVRDAGIIAKEAGPGGQVAGVATEQFRVIEEYNVRIGVFGMNAEEKHHRVVTDYWVPTQASTPRNPMFELLMRSASATAQQDAVHQANVSRARAALFSASPMKAVVTVTESGEAQKRSTVEITSLSSAIPDATLFVLPAGYRVKKNDLNFSL
jgi:hypothetical protein